MHEQFQQIKIPEGSEPGQSELGSNRGDFVNRMNAENASAGEIDEDVEGAFKTHVDVSLKNPKQRSNFAEYANEKDNRA